MIAPESKAQQLRPFIRLQKTWQKKIDADTSLSNRRRQAKGWLDKAPRKKLTENGRTVEAIACPSEQIRPRAKQYLQVVLVGSRRRNLLSHLGQLLVQAEQAKSKKAFNEALSELEHLKQKGAAEFSTATRQQKLGSVPKADILTQHLEQIVRDHQKNTGAHPKKAEVMKTLQQWCKSGDYPWLLEVNTHTRIVRFMDKGKEVCSDLRYRLNKIKNKMLL